VQRTDESLFLELLEHSILIFDGAMGTTVHALNLLLSDYRQLENCTEVLNETRPDVIEQIHHSFLEVGCDAIETNTFGANRLVLTEFGLADRTYDLNVQAAQIARRACDAFANAAHPRFVVGSLGPGTKLISLRQVTYNDLLDSYYEQVRGLLDGGVDVLLIETCQDILQTKAAIQAVRKAFDICGRRVPLMCQITMETTGTMLMGTDIAAALVVLEAYREVDVIGLNCATGPQEMSEHVRYLSRNCSRKISVMPNAGLPHVIDGQARFPLTPEELARWLREFVEVDGVNIVGGCCGTTPEHIKAVVEAVRPLTPRQREIAHEPAVTSLYGATALRQDASFLIIGERCNTSGSRRFKHMLTEGDIDGMLEMANEQIQEGAHVLDICVDCVGRDGVADMAMVMDHFASDLTVPLMLDSTEPAVIEAGLKLAGGKCIVNSVSLEDGERKMEQVCRLLRQYGAAVVALTIDEDPEEAMAKTAERKLAIVKRIHDLLTNKYGIREEDIFFDCLTFPITTGNEEDRRLALETLDAIEAVMKEFPRCQSILGVSNVSFGLQPSARIVLNSAFLYEACQRGLTAAIVHAGKILPRNQISDERWEAALDLIYDRRDAGPTKSDPLERFISLFEEGEMIGEKVEIADLPIEERLKQRIITGNKRGLEADLNEALQTYAPLELINNLLLGGMKVVGELFGSGQMQLPFVLKSAEAMKAAVAHLEPRMDKVTGASRGKLVLATVRGDVHDIGKNLADIILTNNGYTVYNVGIKQPIGNVINALREHNADAIGLSGLLVKSTLVMRDDLEMLDEQNIRVPVILGGAALTRKYVEQDLRKVYKGEVYYARDAFDGLKLMGEIVKRKVPVRKVTTVARISEDQAVPVAVEVATLERYVHEVEQRVGIRPPDEDVEERVAIAPAPDHETVPPSAPVPRSDIGHEYPVPRPPFWGSQVLEEIDLRAALAYVNETMLFQVQWGYRKKERSPTEWKHYLDAEVRPKFRGLVERCEREDILRPQAIYGYWPANSDGDDLIIFEPPTGTIDRPEHHGRQLLRFTFPRQRHAPYWCLADFWRPAASGSVDVAALSIVTVGQRVSEIARQWFVENKYLDYLMLHGLSVESAEALAEYIHKQIRMELGVAGGDARDLQKLFQQGYQGSRYSFGYPACPNLEDQAKLMELLKPERIGITLSEEYQLHPEQSTSALITYHPKARYFNVR
jgi:5-methyltetrahydrofolate--homocysteine methyltransferase